jgi:hypothetical protein
MELNIKNDGGQNRSRLSALSAKERKVWAERVQSILDSLPPVPAGASSVHDDFYDQCGLPGANQERVDGPH